MEKHSGIYWVHWANTHAPQYTDLVYLEPTFRANVESFITALRDAGATVNINATKRHIIRAYLFHWSWLISLGRCKPTDPPCKAGIDIQWDHGDSLKSINGAKEMVKGFGLAVPPKSTVAPALISNHIEGKAIDMDILWHGIIKVKKKDSTEVEISFFQSQNSNEELISVGKSYGVLKLITDEPHWSYNGR